MEPTTGEMPLFRCHFARGRSPVTYSRDQRAQKWSLILCTSCHLPSLLEGSSTRDGSGTALRALPIKKWPGVKAVTSSGSSESGCSGRELRQASICAKSVDISSYVRVLSPRTRRKWCLTDLTAASHNPPKCGAEGGLKRQVTPSLAR